MFDKANPRSVDVLPAERLAEIAVARGAGQKIAELVPVIDLVRELRPRTVVEVGSDRGGTLWLWCRLAAADATVVAVDLPDGPFGSRPGSGWRASLLRCAGPGQELHLIEEDSHLGATRDEVLARLGGRPVDLLFVDGDHSYLGSRRDVELYGPMVAADGLFVFHDIVPTLPEQDCHSWRVWSELKVCHEHREFVDPVPDDLAWRTDGDVQGPWGGLGVVLGPLVSGPDVPA